MALRLARPALLSLLAAACAAAGPPRKAKMSDDGWQQAEAVVRAEMGREGTPPYGFVRHEGLPHLLTARYDQGEDYRLVHHGKIIKPHTLRELGAYFKDVRLLEARRATTEELRVLLVLCELWPPSPGDYMRDSRHPELLPKLVFDAKGGHFHLFYRNPSSGEGGIDVDPSAQSATRWTLEIPPSHQLSWSQETVYFRD